MTKALVVAICFLAYLVPTTASALSVVEDGGRETKVEKCSYSKGILKLTLAAGKLDISMDKESVEFTDYLDRSWMIRTDEHPGSGCTVGITGLIFGKKEKSSSVKVTLSCQKMYQAIAANPHAFSLKGDDAIACEKN